MLVRLRLASLLLGLACATACGTTVATPLAGAAGGPAPLPGSELGQGTVPGAGTVETGSAVAPAPGAPGPGSASGAGAGSATSVGPVAPAATAAPAATPRTAGAEVDARGPGWDEKNVLIGYVTQKGANEAVAAAGAGAIEYGDQEQQARAVIDAINRRGGVLGRTLKPVFHDVATSDSPQSAAQAACVALTQDARVVAVVNNVATIDNEVFYDCLAKAGIPVTNGSYLATDTTRFARYPRTLYSLAMPAYDSITPTYVRRLQTLRYFTGWNATTGTPASGSAKVGLLYPGDPTGTRIAAVLKRELSRAGSPVVAEYGYDRNTADFGTSGVSSAVLRFRNDGVTHVVSVDGMVQIFMTAAAQQEFRPRYALSSFVQPVLLQTLVPASQLTGSIGIGWLPGVDVDAANDPGKGPGEAACKKTMQDAGQDLSNRATELVALATCDGFELFVRAMAAAGSFDATSIQAGAESLQSALPLASVFANGIGPGRHWAPGVFRDLGYASPCSCFRYLDTKNRGL